MPDYSEFTSRPTAGPGERAGGTKYGKLEKRIIDDLQRAKSASHKWREEFKRSLDFYNSHQWLEEDLDEMDISQRMAVVLNRSAAIVDAVVGMEVLNRRSVHYYPVGVEDAGLAEDMTEIVNWARRLTDADSADDAAALDMLIGGIGVSSHYMDYEHDPDGRIMVNRENPLMFFWDSYSEQPAMSDSRWRALIRVMPIQEAEEMFGEKVVKDAEHRDYWNSWVEDALMPQPHDATHAFEYRGGYLQNQNRPTNQVAMVEYQYRAREEYYRVRTPQGLQKIAKEAWNEPLDESGTTWKQWAEINQLPFTKAYRYTYRRAFMLGKSVIEEDISPYEEGFTWSVLTGKRDNRIGGWYGLMRSMIGPEKTHGPQQLSNKLYSEMINAIAVGSKGGLLAEVGAFEDIRKAQQDWATGDQIIELTPGGLGKIQQKPLAPYPQGMDRLMQVCVESIPDVTGVNKEMLGTVGRSQAGVTEEHRKQSAITMMAQFSKAFREYKISSGRILLYMIKEYLAGDSEQDSQVARVRGPQGFRSVSLLRQDMAAKYDLIVDEGDNSPNAKERAWLLLTQIVPFMTQLGYPVPPDIIQYSPLPQALAQSWISHIQSEKPDPQVVEKQKTIAENTQIAEIAEKMANVRHKLAQAAEISSKAPAEAQKLMAEIEKTIIETGLAQGQFLKDSIQGAAQAPVQTTNEAQ